MGIKQNAPELSGQAENLKGILKGFGINTPEELDSALSDALKALTIGIMTDCCIGVKNTA
jgi:hypothetical protein